MKTRILIIGGVAGGATAAARARRLDENAQIVLFERGEYISFANCGLPYYIGQIIKDRDELLVTTPETFAARYNIDIRTFSHVTAIDREKRQVMVQNLKTGQVYAEGFDKLILSPGAEPVRPPLPGVDLPHVFSLRNIPDTDRIKTFVDNRKPESAVVIGGGFIGLEMVENLIHRGVRTILVEMSGQVMPPLDPEMAAIVQDQLERKGVVCKLGSGVSSLSENGDKITVATTTGESFAADMVILSAGVRPEKLLAVEAGLEIGPTGGIRVDETMRTSDPDIFAVGDAVEVRDLVTGLPTMTALAGPANKQGRIAADNALGRHAVFKGTLGTAVLQLFDLTVASVGASEKLLLKNRFPHLVSYTHSGSHASYYPGAKVMAIKLIFAPENGRILGAQIVGEKGVDKRIDVLATAIRAQMTVFDLEELELAYAPPYSSAKDPVNMAGFVAANILKGDVEVVHWHELHDLVRKGHVLIDLRSAQELKEERRIPGAIHIPLNELRSRLPELDREKDYLPFCAVGMRGYVGHRILVQNGFKSRNLSGGFQTLTLAGRERERRTN